VSGKPTQIGPVKTGVYKQADGTVNLFMEAQGPTRRTGFSPRLSCEVGNRNGLRGPAFAGLDMGLSKPWSIDESKRIQFRWGVFNVPNLKRFSVQIFTGNIDAGPSFGIRRTAYEPVLCNLHCVLNFKR